MALPELEVFRLVRDRNFELRVVCDWLDQRYFSDHDHPVIREMGSLLYGVYQELEDRKVQEEGRERRKKQWWAKTEDRLISGMMSELVGEARDIVEGVELEVLASASYRGENKIIDAKRQALSGRPEAVEALLRGVGERRHVNRLMGVAHLIAAVPNVPYMEDQSIRELPKISSYVPLNIPLPRSGEGKSHLLAGVTHVVREIIDRRRQATQKPH